MNKKIIKAIFLLSIGLYITSLFFNAFYINVSQEPYHALTCLLMGIIGFASVPAWLANPLFFVACVQKHKQYSLVLAFFAVFLSLSFLWNKSILTDEGGGHGLISAYGWGYYLWSLSMLTLFFALLVQHNKVVSSNFLLATLLFLIPTLISLALFSNHYYFSENSHYKITMFRDSYMAKHCSLAKEVFYEKPSRYANGIYLSEYSVVRGEQFMGANNPLHSIKYWEQPYIFSGKKLITRFYGVNSYEKDINKIESEYSIITSELTKDIDKKYDIYGLSVAIIDNLSKKKIAEAVSYSTQGRICLPNNKSEYNYIVFVIKGLKLDEPWQDN
jgi:hypothetical protein